MAIYQEYRKDITEFGRTKFVVFILKYFYNFSNHHCIVGFGKIKHTNKHIVIILRLKPGL